MAINTLEMERVISEITSSRAQADPSACIGTLNPLLKTTEGMEFLSMQEGEKALVLIDLFDWVVIYPRSYAPLVRTENIIPQSLKSHGIPLDKGRILWTLRQLCAWVETLPKSHVFPAEFKPSDPCHASGGFADVWRGTYKGREVAFKCIGKSATDSEERLRRMKVTYGILPPTGCTDDTPPLC